MTEKRRKKCAKWGNRMQEGKSCANRKKYARRQIVCKLFIDALLSTS